MQHWLSQSSFSRDAIALFLINVGSAAIGVVTTLILARLLGASNFGVYATAMVYANLFAYIACLGFQHLLIRREARTSTPAIHGENEIVYSTALATIFACGAVLMLIGFAVQDDIMPKSDGPVGFAFLIAMMMVIPVAYQRLGEGTLLGRHRPILSALPDRVVRPTLMLVFLATTVFFVGPGLQAHHGLSAQAFAYVIAIAATLYLVRNNGPRRQLRRPQITHLKDALPFLLVGLTALVAGHVDVIMLAFLTDAKTVGQYRLATQAGMIVMMIGTITQSVLSPRISKLSEEQRLKDLTKKLPRLGIALAAITAVVSSIVYIGFQFALPWLGAEYFASSAILAILLIGYTSMAAFCPALPLLTMTGRATYAALSNGAAIILNATLNLLLIPRFGGEGAAMATATSLVLLYLSHSVWAFRLNK